MSMSCQSVPRPALAQDEEDDRPSCELCGLPINCGTETHESNFRAHAACVTEMREQHRSSLQDYRAWRNS